MNFFSLIKRKIIYNFKKKINIDIDGIQNKGLDFLFHHYGSDKSEIFKKNKLKGHGFSKFYLKEFSKFKKKNIKILEIGSFSGASAAAFSKFFSNSKIFCFDVNISNFIYESKKIQVFGLDINNRKKTEKTLTKIIKNKKLSYFDIIIDDGSHNLSDILFSLKYLFKYVKKKGYYVIEDFKFPNYFSYNKNIKDILVDKMIFYIKKKKFFKSSIFNNKDQEFLHKNIKKIITKKGNLKYSDICFIQKN